MFVSTRCVNNLLIKNIQHYLNKYIRSNHEKQFLHGQCINLRDSLIHNAFWAGISSKLQSETKIYDKA